MIKTIGRRRSARRAGARAHALYEEHKRAWQQRNRRIFRMLWLGLAVVMAASLVVAHGRMLGWYAGVVAGLSLAFVVVMRESPPTWIENYRVGAWGEERTAKALLALADQGWKIVHDVGRYKSNVDHIAIGPPGVFLLDSKNLYGTVKIERDDLSLTRPGAIRPAYRNDRLARSIRSQARQLHDTLVQRGCPKVWVNAVVVVWAEFPELAVTGQTVAYVHGDHLCGWLAAQPARLSGARIEVLTKALQPAHRKSS